MDTSFAPRSSPSSMVARLGHETTSGGRTETVGNGPTVAGDPDRDRHPARRARCSGHPAGTPARVLFPEFREVRAPGSPGNPGWIGRPGQPSPPLNTSSFPMDKENR